MGLGNYAKLHILFMPRRNARLYKKHFKELVAQHGMPWPFRHEKFGFELQL